MRCAFCHEAIDRRIATLCVGCGTRLHVECGADLGRCPTLGCERSVGAGRPGAEADRDAPASRKRPAAWIVFGVVAPVIAFLADANLHVDPLIWPGTALLHGHGVSSPPTSGAAARQLMVLVAAGLSMVGLLAFMLGRRTAAIPFLGLGVALAGAHAIAFAPLLPLSLLAIILAGVGLLGFTPFLASWTYLDVLGRTLREVREVRDPKVGPPFLARLPILPIALAVAVAIPLLRWTLSS